MRKTFGHSVGLALALAVAGCASSAPGADDVAALLPASNSLGVSVSDLQSKANPQGEGLFVFVERTDFSDVERRLVWVVMNDQVYALNGATKGLTPEATWPRDAAEGVWQATGLDPNRPSEAFALVWGDD